MKYILAIIRTHNLNGLRTLCVDNSKVQSRIAFDHMVLDPYSRNLLFQIAQRCFCGAKIEPLHSIFVLIGQHQLSNLHSFLHLCRFSKASQPVLKQSSPQVRTHKQPSLSPPPGSPSCLPHAARKPWSMPLYTVFCHLVTTTANRYEPMGQDVSLLICKPGRLNKYCMTCRARLL